MSDQKHVFGDKIKTCSLNPMTGFYMYGCCNTVPCDIGLHVVCVEVN